MIRRLSITPPTYRMMNTIINHRQIHRIRFRSRLRRDRQRTTTPGRGGQILHIIILRTRHPNRKRERLVPSPRPSISRPDGTRTAIARFGTGATAHSRRAAPPCPSSLPTTTILTGAAAVLLFFRGTISVGIIVVFDLDDDEGVPYAPLGVETNVVYHVLVPFFGGFGERRTDGVYRPPQQFQIGFDGGGGSVLPIAAAAMHAGSAGISVP
mmetsp:Transcript_9494/g.17059  ORF Transcript_9494/g.17059 Transcript_9494/m.17059 type:complete len:211 (-) Transcript_9494:905-1537(-)